MRDYIQLDCDMPWIDDSHIRVYRNDRTWPVQISFTRKDAQMDLNVHLLLRREQVVKLRDFLDCVLQEKEAKE